MGGSAGVCSLFAAGPAKGEQTPVVPSGLNYLLFFPSSGVTIAGSSNFWHWRPGSTNGPPLHRCGRQDTEASPLHPGVDAGSPNSWNKMRPRFRSCEVEGDLPTGRNPRSIAMSHEVRKRIVREATPEEKEQHRVIREQVEQELPELKQ
jgi:hypothetical protein